MLLMVACSTTGQVTDASTTASTTSAPASVTTASGTTASATTASTTTAATTTTTTSTTTSESTTTTVALDMGDLDGWDTATISVGGQGLVVALADEPAERAQGLMGVEELGDLDGMLFVFSQEALSGFWMKGTLISLDIAFFGDDKALVDELSMVPCTTDPCPSYVPDDPFSWALETPAGTLAPLPQGTVLAVGG